MVLLDTNVISELMRESPDPTVARWLSKQKIMQALVSAITIAEIGYGLARLPMGKRRQRLESKFESFLADGFEGRILPFDANAAFFYPKMCAKREKQGFAIDSVDLMIAAIARNANATLATRNTKDFRHCGVQLVNPWEA